MGSPAIAMPPKEEFKYQTVDTNAFPNWFKDNVDSSVVEYDSGIKMHTWIGVPPEMEVTFGTDNRFHFHVTLTGGELSRVTLFDGTGNGSYQRSVIRSEDRVTIVYIPENLLTINYFGNAAE
jgi:hypothetical protein